MTTENTATLWRDLTDQLADTDIAVLEHDERTGFPPDVLLINARVAAEWNAGATIYGPTW